MKKFFVLLTIVYVSFSLTMEEKPLKRLEGKPPRHLKVVTRDDPMYKYLWAFDSNDDDLCINSNNSTVKKRPKSTDENEILFKELCKAAKNDDHEKVKSIIEQNAPIEYGDKSALFSVIKGLQHRSYYTVELNGNKDNTIERDAQKAKKVMLTLLDAGADVNKKNAKGETPLMHAGFYAQKELVETLLQAGADKEKQPDGKSAWQFADEESESIPHNFYTKTRDPYYQIAFSYQEYPERRQACIELLKPSESSSLYADYCARQIKMQNQLNIEALCDATQKLDLVTVQQLLTTGIDLSNCKPDWLAPYPNRPLYLTAYAMVGYVKEARKLNDNKLDRLKKSMQRIAYEINKSRPTTSLKNLNHVSPEAIINAEVNATINNYIQAHKIKEAFIDGIEKSIEITRELVSHGFDVNLPGGWGQTPLMIASLTANKKLVEVLLELGAKTDAKDNLGNSVSDYATIDSEIFKNNEKDKDFNRFIFVSWLLFGETDINNIEAYYKNQLKEIHALLMNKSA